MPNVAAVVDIYARVARALRAHRQAAGLTLERLGEASGISPAYLGQIERGRKKPSLHTVALLAHALNVPPDKLFKSGFVPTRPTLPKRLELLLRSVSEREALLLLGILLQLAKGLRALR